MKVILTAMIIVNNILTLLNIESYLNGDNDYYSGGC